jgi:hypothetical protein
VWRGGGSDSRQLWQLAAGQPSRQPNITGSALRLPPVSRAAPGSSHLQRTLSRSSRSLTQLIELSMLVQHGKARAASRISCGSMPSVKPLTQRQWQRPSRHVAITPSTLMRGPGKAGAAVLGSPPRYASPAVFAARQGNDSNGAAARHHGSRRASWPTGGVRAARSRPVGAQRSLTMATAARPLAVAAVSSRRRRRTGCQRPALPRHGDGSSAGSATMSSAARPGDRMTAHARRSLTRTRDDHRSAASGTVRWWGAAQQLGQVARKPVGCAGCT